jgi:hypothetical protein
MGIFPYSVVSNAQIIFLNKNNTKLNILLNPVVGFDTEQPI